MKMNDGEILKIGSGFSKVLSAENVNRLLGEIGRSEFKFVPVDAETSAVLGRTISWGAIGAGLGFIATTKAPVPMEVRIGSAVAGALVGAGAGYFTATHRIQIRRINPGDSNPFFSVSIEPC